MSNSETNATPFSRLLCACCGMETLHIKNTCIQCRTLVVFPTEQTTVKLSKNARRVLMALDEKPKKRRRTKIAAATYR